MTKKHEQWARRAERREQWAASLEQKASSIEASRPAYAEDYAFKTQPGHIPARARLLAADDRAMRLREAAAAHRSKASNLRAMAGRRAGDAERDRQARRDATAFEVGQQVTAILYGPAEVVKVNAKTVRVRRLATGTVMTLDKTHIKAS